MTEASIPAPDDAFYSGRMHGLDAYRGVLMSLGVVLHTNLFFISNEAGGWNDIPYSDWALPLMWLNHTIHLFRMPAFFALSGFFGALLWMRRGARGTIGNRFERLVLPMVVFAMALHPIMSSVFETSHAFVSGEPDPLAVGLGALNDARWFPGLWHLWFLNYLVWIIAVTLPVVAVVERVWPARWSPSGGMRWLCERPWLALLVLAGLNSAWWLGHGWFELPTDGGWIPNPLIMAYYTGCYLLGWLTYMARPDPRALKSTGWQLLVAGLAAALAKGIMMLPLLEAEWKPPAPFPEDYAWAWPVMLCLGAFACVALSLGLTGLFLRWAEKEHPLWRELSDGSYWIYILHMALAALVAAPLVRLPVPAPLTAAASSVALFLFCWWSYRAFVRWTAIGAFLNGRRYDSPKRLQSLGAFVGLTLLWVGLWTVGPTVSEASSEDEAADRSPWRDGVDALTLLPNAAVSEPFTAKPPEIPELQLDRCIGVDDYILCPDPATYHGAVLGCRYLGGALVTLPTQEDSDALWAIVNALTPEPMLISASDGVEEGHWVWLDGSALSYSPWAEGEPNNYGQPEGCAMMNYEESPGWHDLPCGEHLGFVCRKGPPPRP